MSYGLKKFKDPDFAYDENPATFIKITIIKVEYPVNTTIYFAYQKKNYPPSTPNNFC